MTERTYHLLGIPLRSGSLYPGSENDAQAYRDVHLLAKLRAAGAKAVDDGDIAIPSYLPHHSIPPIRNWPGPRIVWDLVSERLAPLLRSPGHIPVLLGCDCSIVVGSAQALAHAGIQDIHVVYVDGDFDDAPPDPAKSQSAASLAVWLLTHPSPFWNGPALKPSQVTVMGWTNPSRSVETPVRSISLADARKSGVATAVRQALASIPASASVLLHLDIDCMRKQDMPAAYFPHQDGLTLSEATQLFRAFATDRRIRIIEVSEYAALRDVDQQYVTRLAEVLAQGLAE